MRRKSKKTSPEWVTQITALRDRLGINQAELARRMECSAMTISRWERGLLQPSAEHFIQLGNLGNKGEAWFFWEMAGIQPARMVEALGGSRRKKESEFIHMDMAGANHKRTDSDKYAKLIGVPLLKTTAGTHGSKGDKRGSLRNAPISEMVGVPAAWCPNPTYTSLVRVAGSSLEPIIHDRDIVAVDSYQTERRDLNGSMVMLTSEEQGLWISRLRRYDTVDVLEAEVRDHEPLIFRKSGRLRIVGRVLWSITGIP